MDLLYKGIILLNKMFHEIYKQHKSIAHPQFECNCLQRKKEKKIENIWCEHTRENSEAKTKKPDKH